MTGRITEQMWTTKWRNLKVKVKPHMKVPDFDHFVTSGHQVSAVVADINCCATTAMNIVNLSTHITYNHKLMPTLLTH